jgi:hypothetical protein
VDERNDSLLSTEGEIPGPVRVDPVDVGIEEDLWSEWTEEIGESWELLPGELGDGDGKSRLSKGFPGKSFRSDWTGSPEDSVSLTVVRVSLTARRALKAELMDGCTDPGVIRAEVIVA